MAPERRRSPITMPGYRLGMKPANAGQEFPAEIYTDREVLELMAACSSRGRAGVRDRAMLAMLWRGGLRIAELLALLPKDVELDTGVVTILRGKGHKRRVVAVDPQTCALVERWLVLRAELGVGRGRPLFCTISFDPQPGRPIRDSVWRETLKQLARRAEVEKRVHPHGFRHTAAFNWRMAGIDVKTIQLLLGHSSLATTDRYIDHLAPLAAIQAVRALPWPDHELASAA